MISLERLVGEMAAGDDGVRLTAEVVGEMAADSIAVGPWVNLDGLTKGDDDPLPVVVRIPEGKSTRGWYYLGAVLEKIAGEINRVGLPGYEGHQRQEDLAHEFKPIVTHWLGAKVLEEGGKKVLYIRGMVDKSAEQLKRWVRGKMVREVSIFGMPSLRNGPNGTEVYDYRPFSVDWTPPGRAGMPTSVVYAGEIDSTLNGGNDGGHAGGSHDDSRRTTRMPTIRELAGQLRDLNATPQQIIGEMNWRAQDVLPALNRRDLVEALGRDTIAAIPVGEIAQAIKVDDLLPAYEPKLPAVAELVDKTEWGRLQNVQMAVGEMATALGLEKGKDSAGEVLQAVKDLHKRTEETGKAARKGTIDKVVGEMVTVKDLRPLFVSTLDRELPAAVDEDAVKKAVGEMKDREEFKPLLAKAFSGSTLINPTDQRANGNGSGGSAANQPTALRPARRHV